MAVPPHPEIVHPVDALHGSDRRGDRFDDFGSMPSMSRRKIRRAERTSRKSIGIATTSRATGSTHARPMAAPTPATTTASEINVIGAGCGRSHVALWGRTENLHAIALSDAGEMIVVDDT